MTLSYWEQNTWFTDVDFCIVGSGIVGLSCAIHLQVRYPTSKIIVLEKGVLPQGASTKNAGFACFGSASELLSDLQNHTEEEVVGLVQQRVEGLALLKTMLGEKQLDYQQHGGYEVFLKKDKAVLERCEAQLKQLNQWLYPVFQAEVFQLKENDFGFKNSIKKMIFNPWEGQIDTGKMMHALLKKANSLGISIVNTRTVENFSTDAASVHIQLKDMVFKARHLLIATNAFASELLDVDVTPARNQVLITKPIPKLKIKGTFHLDEGYYYFRNIHDRILLGGGRNVDAEGETTTVLATTEHIQKALEQLLTQVIYPHHKVEIEHRWSGILGVGKQKKPIIKEVAPRVYCAVRLGGMGVAIGSMTGKKLADLIP